MAADEVRRRRHGRRMTFVRVATLDINTVDAATTTWPDDGGRGSPHRHASGLDRCDRVRAGARGAGGRARPDHRLLAGRISRPPARPIVAQLKGAGLAAVGDAPIDRLADPTRRCRWRTTPAWRAAPDRGACAGLRAPVDAGSGRGAHGPVAVDPGVCPAAAADCRRCAVDRLRGRADRRAGAAARGRADTCRWTGRSTVRSSRRWR